MYTLNIIGSGRLATHLAMTLAPLTTIQCIYARDLKKASHLQALCQAKLATDQLHQLPPAQLTFIAISDDSIQAIANTLALHPHLERGQHYVHFSGALTCDALQVLRAKGGHLASLHPFRPFTPYDVTQINPSSFQDCYCFVEGDDPTQILLGQLFERCGAIVTPISSLQKNNCHLAGVLASNHLITLATFAASLLEETPLTSTQQQQAIQDIMQHTLLNITRYPTFKDALTGPIARGDLQTIQQHLNGLSCPEQKNLYRLLSLQALKLTSLPYALKTTIRDALNRVTEVSEPRP
ncbi:MAG: DUF2520 domain-containing protein [Gammaproteobacteria bacterium]|nr:DUF2520 domain-containing protein [Gammaproteobacteria bacterium]